MAPFAVIPQGRAHLTRLAAAVGGAASGLPVAVRELGEVFLEQIAGLNRKIGELESQLRADACADEEARRLMRSLRGRSRTTRIC